MLFFYIRGYLLGECMNLSLEWEKLQGIRTQWENKDNEMWQEKNDVFNFMMKHFEYLLDMFSAKYVPYEKLYKNQEITDAWAFLQTVLKQKSLNSKDIEELSKLIGTLCLRIRMLNFIIEDAKDSMKKMEGIIEELSEEDCKCDMLSQSQDKCLSCRCKAIINEE